MLSGFLLKLVTFRSRIERREQKGKQNFWSVRKEKTSQLEKKRRGENALVYILQLVQKWVSWGADVGSND